MLGKRRTHHGDSAPTPRQEDEPATEAQLAEVSLAVSAVWNGLKQGGTFLPAGFTHAIDGHAVTIRTPVTNGKYAESKLTPQGDHPHAYWEIVGVSVQPNIEDEVPKGFLRVTSTIPLVPGSNVIRETAICKPDNDNLLQPIADPTIENMGPISSTYAENLRQSFNSIVSNRAA